MPIGLLLADGDVSANAARDKLTRGDAPGGRGTIPDLGVRMRVMLLGVLLCLGCESPAKKAERITIENAKQILRDRYLVAPATAQYVKASVIASEGDWRMVHVVVDAQNKFGALIRNSLCVTFKKEGRDLVWNKEHVVHECKNPPDDFDIAYTQGVNQMPRGEPSKPEVR